MLHAAHSSGLVLGSRGHGPIGARRGDGLSLVWICSTPAVFTPPTKGANVYFAQMGVDVVKNHKSWREVALSVRAGLPGPDPWGVLSRPAQSFKRLSPPANTSPAPLSPSTPASSLPFRAQLRRRPSFASALLLLLLGAWAALNTLSPQVRRSCGEYSASSWFHYFPVWMLPVPFGGLCLCTCASLFPSP